MCEAGEARQAPGLLAWSAAAETQFSLLTSSPAEHAGLLDKVRAFLHKLVRHVGPLYLQERSLKDCFVPRDTSVGGSFGAFGISLCFFFMKK